MGDIWFNDDELAAFDDCGGLALKIYMRMRGAFDPEREVNTSWETLCDWSKELVERDDGEEELVALSDEEVRTALAQLVREGLLVPRGDKELEFLMPLAVAAPPADA